MKSAILSPQARRDLFSILEHLADIAGPHVARTYDTDFRRAVKNLEDFSGTGTPRPDREAATRVASVAPESEEVQVLRILHGHRNITPELSHAAANPDGVALPQ
jgi:plasmid stabilization system protein ParE